MKLHIYCLPTVSHFWYRIPTLLYKSDGSVIFGSKLCMIPNKHILIQSNIVRDIKAIHTSYALLIMQSRCVPFSPTCIFHSFVNVRTIQTAFTSTGLSIWQTNSTATRGLIASEESIGSKMRQRLWKDVGADGWCGGCCLATASSALTALWGRDSRAMSVFITCP